MKKLQSFLSFFLLFLGLTSAQSVASIQLKDGWKFQTGDNMEYSKANFDDSKWKVIGVDKPWENYGYGDLDGYAWYRIKIIIPSSLKEKSFLKDSLKLFLGKIDDYDQSFINGKILGINGRTVDINTQLDNSFMKEEPIPWDKDRRYVLSVNDSRIFWDKENVIAIRVYDQGGAGGIFSGNLAISMTSISEMLSSDYSHQPMQFSKNKISKTFSLMNNSKSFTIDGTFTILAKNKLNNKIVLNKKSKVVLKPESSQKVGYDIPNKNQPLSVSYTFQIAKSNETKIFNDETPYILTPSPAAKPKINGAKVYGERPGKPFLYTIAATGIRPMTFNAFDLPKGLTIDKKTGIITGKVIDKGEYKVTLAAKNSLGETKGELKIVIGDKLALTPPMGWNSWNCWGLSVDQDKVLASAKVYKEKGLMNHGWTFINIDDGWEIAGSSSDSKRDTNGNILCNSKFPNMKALGDSIHALGLKFGIYSSPGPLTCGGYTASYQYELKDAQSYSSWGIDYLKYDWCSYDKIAKDHSLAELMKPYQVMRSALNNVDRDIVFSLCQYGMGKVWEWGESVGGNLWRTTGDITDTWESLSGIGFNQIENAKYAGPGHWNDPDMLVVGWVGWGPSLHPSNLTPDEQYTHISLWSLLSAPLLIGCDLTKLDDFTLNLLTNDEVLTIDQDPLGKPAVQKIKKGKLQVWVKELEDGNKAVGIFNLGNESQKFELNLSEVGVTSKVKIRDLWRQKNIGVFKDKFETVVTSHGVVLVKIFNY